MHAEKCPICLGSGKVVISSGGYYTGEDVCHGCRGRGWIEVSDSIKIDDSNTDFQIKIQDDSTTHIDDSYSRIRN